MKTKSEEYNSWHWMAKLDITIFRNIHKKDDFIVLVNKTTETADLEYFILRTKQLNEILAEEFQQWVRTPGVNNRPHDPNNRF